MIKEDDEMFAYYDKTQNFERIYNIRDDKNGFPHFLIYDSENHAWKYISAKHFSL